MDSTLKTRKNPKHHPTNHPSRKRRKKKGRPSKADLARRHPIHSLPEPEAPRRRTLRPLRRRRGLEDEEPYFYEYDGEEEDEEDQQEKKHHNKKQKKLTLVLKLNKSSSRGRSSDLNCSATSSLEDDRGHENEVFIKRRRIDRNDCDDDVDDDDYDGDARWNKSDDGKVCVYIYIFMIGAVHLLVSTFCFLKTVSTFYLSHVCFSLCDDFSFICIFCLFLITCCESSVA